MECLACQKHNDAEIILETDFWKIVIASDQAYLGRCFVILKRHRGDLAELENPEWIDFIAVVKNLETALKKSFGAAMFNWTCLMNNAYQNISPNPHVHWHFRPRYDRKVEFYGEIFEDFEFGKHYSQTRKREVPDEIKRKIVERIKENL